MVTEVKAQPRIMVHVVAFEAATTLAKVLDRIPAELRPLLSEICVFDDASSDDTFLVGKGYQLVRDLPQLRVFRNPMPRGYGGNQKLGYRYAIENGHDVVVLLHGSGQYAPDVMGRLLRPILDGEADAVFGSRMMQKGEARRGGMPLYKYWGNKILTRFENAALGMNLTEFHSGYRAYRVSALERIPFEENSDGYHFDTQIMIQLKAGGFRIREVPIPTYYGSEIRHVNGIKYARDVARAVIDFRKHEAGLEHRPEYANVRPVKYLRKESPFASHHRIIGCVRPGSRVLDVGCAGGYVASALADKGCTVVGVDASDDRAARAACSRFYVADLDSPDWAPEERGFDYILFGDVLEHLRDPSILRRAQDWLAPHGRVIASTGNVALWYLRLQLLTGRFRYTPRGILDQTHVHLYTRETFRELLVQHGYHVVAEDHTVIPLEQLFDHLEPGAGLTRFTLWFEQASYQLARTWPELFAYQFVVQAEAAAERT
jgi:2-polyprenyl-3-methyl-5-hydroxy-6-metoxy-1,4-benzoquinol methylase